MSLREMDNPQSIRFLDLGESLEHWPIMDDSVMAYMENPRLTPMPSFSSDFNKNNAIVDSTFDANTSTSLARPSAVFGKAVHPPIISAITNADLEFSLDLPSSRVMKELQPRQSEVISDVAATLRHHRSAEVFEEPNEPQRLGINNKGRDHSLYQNVVCGDDGLFHCPWEGQEECTHQPVKLKCEYDKLVDSHLKPYRCKIAVCEHPGFSSTGSLLRHEREAHGMRGNRPFLCTQESCERSNPGNGFPRLGNLRDHIKRVHSDHASTENEAIAYTSVPDEITKGTKRKVDSTDLGEAPERSITSTAEIDQLHKSRLIENYHQHERRLLEIVKQLHDPRKVSNVLLWDATNCITVLAQTIERIKGRQNL